MNRVSLNHKDIHILVSTKEFHDKFFSLIKQAKHRIYISALYLENDATGRKVLDALYEAKSNNPLLDIVILIDFHRAQRDRIGESCSGGSAKYYFERNQQSKHPISIYGLPVKGREFLGVMHLKGFIFDNQVLYSGASINDVYFHAEDHYRYDRYTLIQSAQLADAMVEFIQRLRRRNNVLTPLNLENIRSAKSMKRHIRHSTFELKRSQYIVPSYPQEDTELHISPILGFGRRGNRLNKTVIDIIKAARKEIILYTPYFNFPSALRKAIVKAMRRNVKVLLVIGDKTASDFFIRDTEKFSMIGTLPYFYEMLLRGFIVRHRQYISQELLSIRLWQHDHNSFHVKGVSVDDHYYLLTGNNLNPRAWGLDLENALLLYDRKEQMKSSFQNEHQHILKNTTPLSSVEQLEHPKQYPAPVIKILRRLKRLQVDKVLKHFI